MNNTITKTCKYFFQILFRFVIYLVSMIINAALWMAGYVPITVKVLSSATYMPMEVFPTEVFTPTVVSQLISWSSLICDCAFRLYLWLILPLHIESNEIISHKTVLLLLLIHLTGVICGLVFRKGHGIIIIVGKGLVVPIEIIRGHQG